MIGKLILTHGGLGRELLSAAQVIAGRADGIEAVCLGWQEGIEEARERVGAAVERLDQGQGVLILTDMYGGTPCNLAMGFLDPGHIEVLTGVNLPMVLRLACQSSPEAGDVAELAHWTRAKGQGSLCLGSDMVQGRKLAAAAGDRPGEGSK